jgi:D-alanyl-lipoteichoic acid acyltransferase DltB (MBOAT superfamily)
MQQPVQSGATQPEPAGRAAGLLPLGLALAQLAIVLLLVERFRLESQAFRGLVWIALLGFPIHHLLPLRLRLPAFVALSLAGIAYVLGLEPTGWSAALAASRGLPLLAIGLSLIGICHLPLRWSARILLLVAAGVALAVCRAHWLRVPALDAVWPVLGSMFMFRLIVYVYDLRHEKEPARASRSLAYFFMLPNVAFPLFPVVDYKTFARRYYDEPAFEIYQRGIDWMMRGVVHLALWRVVYHEIYLDPATVSSGGELARFLLSNMALYLRVSGQFHVVVGMLLLFGFNLPVTNNRYFLASSFNDYWRRINIYWKDFMVKCFYRPLTFALRRFGTRWSVVVATALTFVVTWALHSYQWFWLRGAFPIKTQDAVFWGLLGGLVTYNSLRELEHGRKRRLGKRAPSWSESGAGALRTAATFAALTLLWSFWSIEQIDEWFALWRHADLAALGWFVAALAGLAAVALAADRAPSFDAWLARLRERGVGRVLLAPAIRTCVAPAAVLLLATGAVGWARVGPPVSDWVHAMGETRPNVSDGEFLVQGYYEDLMDVSRFNALLNEAYMSVPASWVRFDDSPARIPLEGFLAQGLAASQRVQVNDFVIETNGFGMRDREYSQAKPPGTLRVAMLGSSVLMGWGVNNEEGFEALLEERLNREQAEPGGTRYELLNFGVNGYGSTSAWVVLRDKALAFEPDAVVLIAHAEDRLLTAFRLSEALRKGYALPDPFLAELGVRADVDTSTPERWASRRIAPFVDEVVAWSYAKIVATCRERGIEPIWIFVPTLSEGEGRKDAERLREHAERAGFRTVVLERLYEGVAPESLFVAPWDQHPNAQGHQRIADGMFRALTGADPPGPPLLAARR